MMDHENKNLVSLAAILFMLIAIHSALARPRQYAPPKRGIVLTPSHQEEYSSGVLTSSQKTVVLPPRIPPPEITAHAYMVRVMGQEMPLIAQREWKKLPPASLTKLFTAVLAEEFLEKKDYITMSEASKNIENPEAKVSRISTGERLLRDDAIRFMLIESANDIAHALVEAIAQKRGTEENSLTAFRKIAHEKLEVLELLDTNFENPSGLDEVSHYTTAENLSRLAEYIWHDHPDIWADSRIAESEVISEGGTHYMARNTNELLGEFPSISGGKTGLTSNAKGSLLLLYPVRLRQTAIIVILRSENRFDDGRKIIRWLDEAF